MQPTHRHDLLTTAEVARYFRCSPKYVRQLARSGELDHYEMARRWLYRAADVEATLQARPQTGTDAPAGVIDTSSNPYRRPRRREIENWQLPMPPP